MTKTKSLGNAQIAHFAITTQLHKHAIQWEEVLPHITAIPEGAAICGRLVPVTPTLAPRVGDWIKPIQVFERHTTADAINTAYTTLCGIGGIQIGWCIYDRNMQIASVKKHNTRKNYRGTLADGQFTKHITNQNILAWPMFRLTDAQKVLSLFHESSKLVDSEWYWDVVESTKIDTLLELGQQYDNMVQAGDGMTYMEKMLAQRQVVA